MNSLIESLNMWGERFADAAFPLFWQSSLLVALVFVMDGLAAARKFVQPFATPFGWWSWSN